MLYVNYWPRIFNVTHNRYYLLSISPHILKLHVHQYHWILSPDINWSWLAYTETLEWTLAEQYYTLELYFSFLPWKMHTNNRTRCNTSAIVLSVWIMTHNKRLICYSKPLFRLFDDLNLLAPLLFNISELELSSSWIPFSATSLKAIESTFSLDFMMAVQFESFTSDTPFSVSQHFLPISMALDSWPERGLEHV